MTRDAFEKNLRSAIKSTLDATRRFVVDKLPDEVKLLIVPNCSFDGNPLEDDEEVYPEEKLPEWTTLPPKTEDEVTKYLYRNGKVPEWINLKVESAYAQSTSLILECCGRYTAMDNNLYHKDGGTPPFNPQVPMPGLDYELGRDGKFRLRPRYNNKSEPDEAR